MLERVGQARWLGALADYEALLNETVADHGGTPEATAANTMMKDLASD